MSRSGSQPVAVSRFGYPLFHLPSTSCFNPFLAFVVVFIVCTVEIHALVTRCFVKVLFVVVFFCLCVCVRFHMLKSWESEKEDCKVLSCNKLDWIAVFNKLMFLFLFHLGEEIQELFNVKYMIHCFSTARS